MKYNTIDEGKLDYLVRPSVKSTIFARIIRACFVLSKYRKNIHVPRTNHYI